MSEEEENVDREINSESKEIEINDKNTKIAMDDGILASGRAAALELLKEMKAADEPEYIEVEAPTYGEKNANGGSAMKPLPESNNEKLQSKSDAPDQLTSNNQSSDEFFNTPSRKSHCMTISLVPPPSATRAWEQLTAVRKECKDPGFYRWPPHANILYPFLEPVYNEGDSDDGKKESKDVQLSRFRNEMAMHLKKAAQQCKPFDLTIDSFGTFGGKQRGVLWAYPKSKYTQESSDDQDADQEPLIRLHGLLEQHFPMCKDQRKGGAFHPHMTVSHYENNDNALAAKKGVESGWKLVSFHVPEIYLLQRKGDDGQFKIAATIPLGNTASGEEVLLHDPPIAFPAMPDVEEEWVLEERMAMKKRRKNGFKRRRRRRGGGSNDGHSSEESQKERNS